MANTNDLIKLAQKLASEGPHKAEVTPRRVRALLGGKYAFDTAKAYHVWEHPYYPQFYVPLSSFTSDAKLTKTSSVDGTNNRAHLARLSLGDKSTERVVVFNTDSLKDLVKIDFSQMDQWFEEDVPIHQHPKDPYKRIDILNSTRSIRVALDGVTLAETSSPLFLLETMLRPRYYLPPTSVKWEYLTKSNTETYCPYKGKANYYNANINGKEYKDVVWYYIYPIAESLPVAGHFCFYNEKVDIWVDGVQEKR
ncbi:DUF427-domain-containing protein [Lindgomyces ingoldianus]|uniref:DUF427-domain-containing protein n=1 Tax=Lindgomyces ingoldianus TaxID=673940 RepID=A0ACB6R8P8_9PLEO|nr:DUF427-domain-containing protein [Lindgomyces ingoldianus]KAF2475120.1 DUF427-domain-containing protein [Lindgomyces ingoldianus]